MMGINVDGVIVFTFVVGSALAGAAGVFFALRVPTTVSIGFVAGLKGFTAAVIGGIGSIPGAMAGCAVLGVAIERFAYRPLRDAPRIAPLISALGVSFFLANSMQLLFGAAPRTYDTFAIHDAVLYTSGFDIGNVHMPLLRVITIAAAFLLMVALWLVVNRTQAGKAMRATSFDR